MASPKIETWFLGLCLVQASCVPLPEGIPQRDVDASVPDSFGTVAAKIESAAALPVERFFHDANLIALVEQALANNQELNILQMEVAIANAEVMARTGEYQPKVGVGAGVGLERVGRYTSQGASDAVPLPIRFAAMADPASAARTPNLERFFAMDKKCIRLQGLCLLAAMTIGSPGIRAQCPPQAEAVEPDAVKLSGEKPANMSKPVQVFILLGQSNMVGMGKVSGGEASLEAAVKERKKYPYLVDEAGNWIERKDVRFVRYMQGKGRLANEWMTVKRGTIGPELGIGRVVGDAVDAPVMILKSCIGNRSLGWDLLPPDSERFEAEVTERDGKKVTKVFAGYKDRPDSWVMDPSKGTATEPPPWLDKKGNPIDWYAGKQYDDDIADAKKALADLDQHYPGAKRYEVAGFFFWQGEKDCGNAVHASRYEQNLVHFIQQLRKDFDAPGAKFVLATLGEATKGCGGNTEKVFEAHLAVDGRSGKYPEFRGNVATVVTHPLAQGGSGNGHYGGKAEVYMDVGEAMGKAMIELLGSK